MPDYQSRGNSDFSIYDTMSDEELQQILREDASKPVGEESDTEMLFYVMGVLAKRRKERNEGKSPAEALESFKQHYYTENENSNISEKATVVSKRNISGRWRRGLVAAAAVLVLVIGTSITASALGFDLWDVIAKWTQETFHFGYAGQTEETNAPSSGHSNPCASLQEALDKRNIMLAIVPTWMPEGYVESDVRISDSPKQRSFTAEYTCGDNTVTIRIANYLNSNPTQIEQSDSLIDIYKSAETDYYIFDNDNFLQAVWIDENFECVISGPLTLSDMKKIIDSIEKG